MPLKTLITLLSLAIVLVTSANDFYCNYGRSVDRHIETDNLFGSEWPIIRTTDPNLSVGTDMRFNRTTENNSNLIFTRNLNGEELPSMFMQFVAPGQYRFWNTSDTGFNPSQPGDVLEIGQAKFVILIRNPVFNGGYDGSLILVTCYLAKDGPVSKYVTYARYGKRKRPSDCPYWSKKNIIF